MDVEEVVVELGLVEVVVLVEGDVVVLDELVTEVVVLLD